MKTDELIDLLSSGVESLAPRAVERRLALTALFGGVLATALTLGVFGLNPQLREFLLLSDFWVKMTFTGALSIAALAMTLRLARPGNPVGAALWWAVAAYVALWLIGAGVLVDAGSGNRVAALLGHTWRKCPFNIALLSLPIFVALAIALRSLAPTRLREAGAAAGFFSGAFGAFVYGLHCPELAAPFIGTWYVLGMAIPTAIGAAFGPRLLRW